MLSTDRDRGFHATLPAPGRLPTRPALKLLFTLILSDKYLFILIFIDHFIEQLETARASDRLSNPYLWPHRSDNLRAWLRAIMRQPGRRVLVIGEALGYRGGVHTGIPFSSSRLINRSMHPFWRRLRPELTVSSDISEATASIVWETLQQRRRIPLFWNALPFHPHQPGVPLSNRTPDRDELAAGLAFLRLLAQHYQPDLVAGVGAKGTHAAETAFPGCRVKALRHPSYGGKQAFVQGINRLLG